MREGIELIKKWEGLELKAYLCPAGKATIGYGATFYEDGSKVKLGDVITKERAESLLNNLYDLFEADVKLLINHDLNPNQLGALVSFAFNLGIGNLEKSTLLKKVNAKDYVGAQNEFGKWVYANKVKLKGLVNRRAEESVLWATPYTVAPLNTQDINVASKTLELTQEKVTGLKNILTKLLKPFLRS